MKRDTAGSSMYSDQQLILAARLYFIDGMSQSEIGTFVRVSQSKVSRMLAIAQQRGLVSISVPEYKSRNVELERQMRALLGIETVVIHAIPGIEVKPLRLIVSYFAVPVVRQWLQSKSLVVLSGGRMVQQLIEQMQPSEGVRGIRVAQGMGHIDATPGPYDAAELCRSMAKAWNGSVLSLNAPLLFPDKDTCNQFMRLPQIRSAVRSIAHADVAIVGVGTLDESVLVERSVFSKAEIADLRKAGATGEILGRFFDKSGVECKTGLRDRTVSLELEKLRQIKRRVGVVVGTDRAEAVLAAVRGDLLNTLVIDENSAAALIEVAGQNGTPAKTGSKR